MTIKDFKNKKVTVIGLGLHGGGVGTVKFLCEAGAKVIATDLRNKEELKESIDKLKGYPVKYVLGQHRSEDFINTDLIIKNPAVSDKSRYLQIAKENNIAIDTDIGIFFELCPAPIIGITGSKGKSTTATLISEFLKQKYSDVVLAGNIRTSVLDVLGSIKKNTLVVLELSSWQLAGLQPHKKSPHYAVLTNILPDHLNSYKNMESYITDKKEIFRWQKLKDILVLNYDDATVRAMAHGARKSRIFYYTASDLSDSENVGAYIKESKIFFDNKEICSLADIKLKGQHNISNILAAVTIAKFHNVSDKNIKKVLGNFQGLTGRIEAVRTVNGVKYINDTTATIPEATLAALASLPLKNNIILIAGGADKNLDFSQLAKAIVKRVKALVLLEGTGTLNLRKSIEKELQSDSSGKLNIIGSFNEMKAAVLAAQKEAQEEDVVLLSPACASFGMFKHEFERGDIFKKIVSKLQ